MRHILIAVVGIAVLCLQGCSAGGQLQGNRGPNDNGCTGITVTAGGGGYVGLMAPGALGTIEITPTGCKATITGWEFPPPRVAATAPAPVPPVPAAK